MPTLAHPAQYAPPPSADGPLFIVLNERSGHHGDKDREEEISSILNAAGREYQLLRVRDATQLRETASRAVALAKQRHGVVVAAGGDGTQSAVAAAVLQSALPFGVLPQGTFNYFGRVNGISQDTAEATRGLLTARVSPIQVGQLNGRLFLVNASVGLYPVMLEDRETFKHKYGRTRFVAMLASLWTVLAKRREMVLKLDPDDAEEHVVRTALLFVGNNALQLQQIGLPQAHDVQQGRLAAICVKAVSRPALLNLALHGALGKLAEADNVVDFSFREMDVRPWGGGRSGKRRVKVAMDGETSWMESPLIFKVADLPLNLLVPQLPASGLEAKSSAEFVPDPKPLTDSQEAPIQ